MSDADIDLAIGLIPLAMSDADFFNMFSFLEIPNISGIVRYKLMVKA